MTVSVEAALLTVYTGCVEYCMTRRQILQAFAAAAIGTTVREPRASAAEDTQTTAAGDVQVLQKATFANAAATVAGAAVVSVITVPPLPSA